MLLVDHVEKYVGMCGTCQRAYVQVVMSLGQGTGMVDRSIDPVV